MWRNGIIKKDFNNAFFITHLGFLLIFFTFVTPKTPSVLYALVRQPADGSSGMLPLLPGFRKEGSIFLSSAG